MKSQSKEGMLCVCVKQNMEGNLAENCPVSGLWTWFHPLKTKAEGEKKAKTNICPEIKGCKYSKTPSNWFPMACVLLIRAQEKSEVDKKATNKPGPGCCQTIDTALERGHLLWLSKGLLTSEQRAAFHHLQPIASVRSYGQLQAHPWTFKEGTETPRDKQGQGHPKIFWHPKQVMKKCACMCMFNYKFAIF